LGKKQATFAKGGDASQVPLYGEMRSGRYAYKELNKDVQHLLPKALEEIQLHGQGGHFSHGQITHEKM